MSGILDWVVSRFQHGGHLEPRAYVEFVHNVPPIDTNEDHGDGEHHEAGDLAGQSFVMQYVDAVGEVSNRRITVRSLKRNSDGSMCICAMCWERKAIRSFRVDRIERISRITDPTPIMPIIPFFEGYLKDHFDPATAQLMVQIRPGLRALRYLAQCDGRVHEKELDCMREYVRLVASRPIQWETVDEFLKDQHPDRELAKASIYKIARNPEQADALLTAANLLIAADGVVRPEEIAGLRKIEDLLSA
jgi:hypothetical protein